MNANSLDVQQNVQPGSTSVVYLQDCTWSTTSIVESSRDFEPKDALRREELLVARRCILSLVTNALKSRL